MNWLGYIEGDDGWIYKNNKIYSQLFILFITLEWESTWHTLP
jgi:hypothetical protein